MSHFPKLSKNEKELDSILLKSIMMCDSVSSDKTLEGYIMAVKNKREQIIKEYEEKHKIWQNQTTKKWCTKLGSEKHLIVRKERRDLENAIVEFYLTYNKMNASVDDVFQNWRQYEEGRTEHTQKTINEYTHDYNRFLANRDFVNIPICDVTESDIVKLMKSIVCDGEPIPQKRFKAVKTIMRTIFNHARLQMDIECIAVKHILDDIRYAAAYFKESNYDSNNEVFKHSEIKMIKAELANTDDLLEMGILLTIETGLRVGELCTLKRDCVFKDCLKIQRSEHRAKFDGNYKFYVEKPKKNKTRTVQLNRDAKEIVTKILGMHNSDWLFPSPNDASDWMRSYYFDKAIRKVCRRLNIRERSMHKLRKTYASYLLSQNVPEKLVQEQLGHADISTTHRSYHYNIFDNEETTNILGAIHIG